MKLSEAGIEFIKSYETLRLKAYKALPTEKYYSIGYGHYSEDVRPSDTITENEALELFRQDISIFETCVLKFITPVLDELKQFQFDALVSLAFNIGLKSFKESTLLKKLLQKDFIDASNNFLRWHYSGGKPSKGLLKRRQAEKLIFDKGVYNSQH